MTNIQAPNGYTINFDGQGGVAGFGKGSADVALSAQGDQTLLKYNARASVGGKMAQIGSRLIDATAGKITEDFFKASRRVCRRVRRRLRVRSRLQHRRPSPAAASPNCGG